MSDWLRKIFYKILGKIFKNQQINIPIVIKDQVKILIFRYDKIGDMVVSFPSFEFLRDKLPNSEIWILASERNIFLLNNFASIDKAIKLPTSIFHILKTLFLLRKQKFNIIINFVFHRTTKAGLLANFISPNAIKINLGHETRNEIYCKLFNVLVNTEKRWNVSMSEFLLHYLCSVFGFSFERGYLFRYNFWIPNESLILARDFVRSIPKNYLLLINISARLHWDVEKYKILVKRIIENCPDLGIIFIFHPSDKKRIEKIVNSFQNKIYVFNNNKNFYDVIALIKYIDIVFTPDTSIVHFANAFNKPIVFMCPLNNSYVNEWQPNIPPFAQHMANSKENYKGIQVEEIFQSIRKMLAIVDSNKISNLS